MKWTFLKTFLVFDGTVFQSSSPHFCSFSPNRTRNYRSFFFGFKFNCLSRFNRSGACCDQTELLRRPEYDLKEIKILKQGFKVQEVDWANQDSLCDAHPVFCGYLACADTNHH
jgi:hypothetical protein